MCSIIRTKNSQLEIKERHDVQLRRCGNVSISHDMEFLTLHCVFCEFDDRKLETFLYHLRNEHLKFLHAEIYWSESTEEGTIVASIKEEQSAETSEDIKICKGNENDPLLPENYMDWETEASVIKRETIESNDEQSVSSLVDESTQQSFNESSLTKDIQAAERPKNIHIFKLIDHFHNHPTLWNSKLRNRYIRTERQQAYKDISTKLLKEFPNIKIDYQYVLVKISKLKKLYFNYNENDQKLTKNEKKFYEKLHFLKNHPPNKEKKKKCLLCHKEVFDLPRHVINHHDDNETFQTCKVCSELQPSERHLKMHLRSAHRRYECEYCDVVYVALNSLNNHIRKKHSDKPQPPVHPLAKLPSERICEYCGRQFDSKQVLNKHKRFVHLQQRPYACTECSKTYKAKDKLQSHINSAHLNVRPHVCEICSKGFFDKKTLKQHMRTHNKVCVKNR